MQNQKIDWITKLTFTLWIAGSFTSSLAALPQKQSWNLDPTKDEGKVEFVAIGKPSLLKIHGVGAAPKGNFAIQGSSVSGRVEFALQTLDSGIEMRDKHMKEKYLELEKFPVATLEIKNLILPRPAPEGDFAMEGVAFEGPLTLHGLTKPVKGTAKIARAGGQMLVEAEFGLKITDFAIPIPNFAGIAIADEVKIHVESKASKVASK